MTVDSTLTSGKRRKRFLWSRLMMNAFFESVRSFGMLILLVSAGGLCGCDGVLSDIIGDGITIVIERPTECFEEQLIGTECFTQETLVTVCEEDIFGSLDCFDELIIEVVCEDVIIETFLICE